MKGKVYERGFTIVELLVVSTLIAILASFIFVSVAGTRARSRDARREGDMKEIQNALQLFSTNTHRFPLCAEGVINGVSDCLSAQLLAAGAASYISVDPLGRGTGTCGNPADYVYCYGSDGITHTLRYHLETNSIQGKTAGWQSTGP